MDMSFVLLIAVGFLTSVMAGLLEAITAVVRRRVSGKPIRR